MNHRRSRALLSVGAPFLALLMAGCGNYEPPAKAGAGSSSGGQAATGGAAGSGGSDAGQAGSGGAAGSGGGQAGAAGSAGSGGQAGASGGGGGGGGAVELPCPDPVPTDTTCGGDVVGTWAATSCPLMVTGEVNMMGLGLGCPAGQITSGSLVVSGTFTAVGDGTYMDNTSTKGEQEIELPPTCLTVSGFVTTCDRVSDPFGSTLGYASVACVDNAETGGCTCQATIDQKGGLGLVSLQSPDDGTYTAMGESLVTTQEDVDTEYSYCVAASTLALTMKTVGKTGTVMGPLVLQKQ